MPISSKPGGYGQEFYGDPMGGGGSLHVLRVVPIASHVLRVVFNEQPRFKSPSGIQDSRNPANYQVAAIQGVVTDPATGQVAYPMVVGVGSVLAVPPAVGLLAAEERGVDIHVDRPLVMRVLYRVYVGNVVSAFGGTLGAPTQADTIGMATQAEALPPLRSIGYRDLAEDPATGAWVFSDGDMGTHEGIPSLRKRVLRRATTTLNGFTFLAGYGAGQDLKAIANSAVLQTMRNSLETQCKEEPDLASIGVSMNLDPLGVMIVTLRVQTNFGEGFVLVARRDTDGSVDSMIA